MFGHSAGICNDERRDDLAGARQHDRADTEEKAGQFPGSEDRDNQDGRIQMVAHAGRHFHQCSSLILPRRDDRRSQIVCEGGEPVLIGGLDRARAREFDGAVLDDSAGPRTHDKDSVGQGRPLPEDRA